MADPAQFPRMTVDEFLAWDDGTDTRYELADGEVRAMAAPSATHRTILGNLIRDVGNRLVGRPPCRVEVEAALRIDEGTLWQADAAVVCGPLSHEVVDPLVLIEVQSPSTRMHDLGRKLDDYKDISSVQEIWMIDSARRRVQIWCRVGQEWTGRDYIGRSEFTSPAIAGAPFMLDAIYANSGL